MRFGWHDGLVYTPHNLEDALIHLFSLLKTTRLGSSKHNVTTGGFRKLKVNVFLSVKCFWCMGCTSWNTVGQKDGAAAAAPGGQLCFLSWGVSGGGCWLTHGPLF